MVPRKKVESLLINDLKEKFLTVENLRYVYENVEKAISKTLNEVPEELRLKGVNMTKSKLRCRTY